MPETLWLIAASLAAVVVIVLLLCALYAALGGFYGMVTKRKSRAQAKASGTHPVFSGKE